MAKPSMNNKSCQVLLAPKYKNTAVQTLQQFQDASIQCDLIVEADSGEPEPMDDDQEDDQDPDWLPDEHAMEDDSDDDYSDEASTDM